MFRKLRRGLRLVRVSELALRRETCSLCGCSVLLRLNAGELGVRCPRCGASAISMSLAAVIRARCSALASLDVWEMSAQGPVVDWLRRAAGSLCTSEYFDDIAAGAPCPVGGVCQDVQRLTWADGRFDLCTSTEVFEHVEDDRLGFSEVRRVLRPGGQFIFTVPLTGSDVTVERTELRDGRRIRILPAEYHGDRYRGQRVFCYRNYGRDITARLLDAGFAQAVLQHANLDLFGCARPVVVATAHA